MLYETAYEGRKHILWQLLEKEERVEASGGEGEVWETPPSGEEANRDGEGEKRFVSAQDESRDSLSALTIENHTDMNVNPSPTIV